MVKCPHCGREITSLSLEVVEVVRYNDVYFDGNRLVLTEHPERIIYDRKQHRYLCPHRSKLITYYTKDAIAFLKGESIRIPKENYFRLIV